MRVNSLLASLLRHYPRQRKRGGGRPRKWIVRALTQEDSHLVSKVNNELARTRLPEEEQLTSYSYRRFFMNRVLTHTRGDLVKAAQYSLHLNPRMLKAHYEVWEGEKSGPGVLPTVGDDEMSDEELPDDDEQPDEDTSM